MNWWRGCRNPGIYILSWFQFDFKSRTLLYCVSLTCEIQRIGTSKEPDLSLWRNRLARSAVNRKVGGSSPPRDVTFEHLWRLHWQALSIFQRCIYMSDFVKIGLRESGQKVVTDGRLHCLTLWGPVFPYIPKSLGDHYSHIFPKFSKKLAKVLLAFASHLLHSYCTYRLHFCTNINYTCVGKSWSNNERMY